MKSMKASPLTKGGNGLSKAKKKGLPKAKVAKTKLKAKNLRNLGKMTLDEKVQKVAESTDNVQEAAQELKGMLDKQEHSRVWSKFQTHLSKQGQAEKDEFNSAGKNQKGLLAAMHMLKSNVPKFFHLTEGLSQSSTLDKRERWLSEAKMVEHFGQQEFWAHVESGRIQWRSDPWTPGIYNYRDLGDIVKHQSVKRAKEWTAGQEYEAGPEDDDPWQKLWGKDMALQLHDVEAWGKGKSLSKGNVKGSKGGKGKGKQLALQDGKVEEEEKEEKTEEEQWKELLAKAKRARDQATSAKEDCSQALLLADKAKRLTKASRQDSEEVLKALTKKANQVKELLAKKEGWGSLTKATALMVDVSKEIKKTKDETRELNQLAHKANSKAASKR